MPDVQISIARLLVAAGGAAVLYAYWHAIVENRTALRLIRWLRSHYPEVWNAQAPLARNLNRLGALAGVARSGKIDDPLFCELHAKVTYHRNRKLISLSIGLPLLALFGVAVKFWGWQV